MVAGILSLLRRLPRFVRSPFFRKKRTLWEETREVLGWTMVGYGATVIVAIVTFFV